MATATMKEPCRLLTPIQAAEFLQVKVQTLATWRSEQRHGLPYVQVGHLIRYRPADLQAWLISRTIGEVKS